MIFDYEEGNGSQFPPSINTVRVLEHPVERVDQFHCSVKSHSLPPTVKENVSGLMDALARACEYCSADGLDLAERSVGE